MFSCLHSFFSLHWVILSYTEFLNLSLKYCIYSVDYWLSQFLCQKLFLILRAQYTRVYYIYICNNELTESESQRWMWLLLLLLFHLLLKFRGQNVSLCVHLHFGGLVDVKSGAQNPPVRKVWFETKISLCQLSYIYKIFSYVN